MSPKSFLPTAVSVQSQPSSSLLLGQSTSIPSSLEKQLGMVQVQSSLKSGRLALTFKLNTEGPKRDNHLFTNFYNASFPFICILTWTYITQTNYHFEIFYDRALDLFNSYSSCHPKTYKNWWEDKINNFSLYLSFVKATETKPKLLMIRIQRFFWLSLLNEYTIIPTQPFLTINPKILFIFAQKKVVIF